MVDIAPKVEKSLATQKAIAIQQSLSFARKQSPNQNLLPALSLSAFTLQERQESEETILRKGQELIREEQTASIFLPTVGLEIEGFFDITTLRDLKFPAGQEHVHISGRDEPVHNGLNEIRLNPTRSALIQINMLNNLSQIGILPRPNLPREISLEAYGVQKPPSLSTHLNFGLAEGITKPLLDSQTQAIIAISDAFTASYVSPERLRERKTKQAWAIKEATPQEKEKHQDKKLYRAELRTGEVTPYDTPRSVHETQRVVACWQADIKQKNKIPLTDTERKLATLWQKGFMTNEGKQVGGFIEEVKKLREQYGWTPNLPDTDQELAISILETQPLFKLEMGMIMVSFAQEVDKILAQAH